MSSNPATSKRRPPTDDERAAGHQRQAELGLKSCPQLLQDAKLHVGPAQEAAILKRLSQMPVRARNGYLKAMKGNSMGSGVKSHCLHCVGWLRPEVRLCSDPGCALYPYRPFQE